jgi:hypothetical protein
MTSANPVYATETRGAHSPPDSVVSAEELPNETSPLLQHKPTEGPQQNVSERLHPASSSVSAFINNNAGMLLIVASQFFLSAMNVSVKLLNSLDEPVPTLEVRHVPRVTKPMG